MAKITAPFLSFGATGSLAKTLVASKWKGRPYMRRHVVPANPQTTAQTTTRTTFSNASEIWKQMGSIGVAPWDRFAQGQVLTGRNAFMGRWVETNRGQADLAAAVFSPGAKGGLPPVTLALTAGSTQITVDTTNPSAPTGWTLTAMQCIAIRDQDPETGVLFTTTEGEDAVTFNQVVLSGLTASVLYQVGAWLKWTKPDGSIAYSPSSLDSATPLV